MVRLSLVVTEVTRAWWDKMVKTVTGVWFANVLIERF